MTAETKRVGPVGLCPRCGHHAAYALTYPIFAYGTEGGSSGCDGYECGDCEHEWSAP